MVLVSRYPITVCIDDKEFKIVAGNETPALKERFKKLFKNDDKDSLKREKIQGKINRYQNEFKLNSEILESGIKGDKRVAILMEQKELNKKLFDLKDDLDKLPPLKLNDSLDQMIEEHNIYTYDVLISGDDKDDLKRYCEDNGISLKELFREINELKSKEKEKK